MMKTIFLNVYEKVFVMNTQTTFVINSLIYIPSSDFVEIFQKNGQKSMKNGRFGSVFLHVIQEMVSLSYLTFGYNNMTPDDTAMHCTNPFMLSVLSVLFRRHLCERLPLNEQILIKIEKIVFR